MARNKIFMVSDDTFLIEKFKSFCAQNGVEMKSFAPAEWDAQMQSKEPALASGMSPVDNNVIPFPKVGSFSTTAPSSEAKVKTINELESLAIENAINEFNGNLTEAAKALGIGRATLYRKVKQYSIDPSQARRKKAA